MRVAARSAPARRDIRTRQQLMERSFARGTRFGFDRARWRGRWRVAIQEYLSAAIQNIEVLIRYARHPRRSSAAVQTTLRDQDPGLISTIGNMRLLPRAP